MLNIEKFKQTLSEIKKDKIIIIIAHQKNCIVIAMDNKLRKNL